MSARNLIVKVASGAVLAAGLVAASAAPASAQINDCNDLYSQVVFAYDNWWHAVPYSADQAFWWEMVESVEGDLRRGGC